MTPVAGVFVLGGGPAGSVFAARMAALGHDVTLAERRRFPRPALGESLSPGVAPLLESLGAGAALEGATPVREVVVQWEGQARRRDDPRAEGRLVDRGAFDARLLDHARGMGVRVLQPATLRAAAREAGGWALSLDVDGRPERRRADFLAWAGGRGGPGRDGRAETGCRTVALHAYWRSAGLPRVPRIEAGEDAWFWGVPLPSGLYNTLAFTEAATLRAVPGRDLAERFMALVARSGLMRDCGAATRAGPVRATDATPYLHGRAVSPDSIRVGDAALALDAVSSTGVQKAIQTALAAAVTANTHLRRPGLADAATAFYESSLRATSERHRAWAAQYYAEAARHRGGAFWQSRAAAAPAASGPVAQATEHSLATRPVWLAPGVELAEQPCLDGAFVTLKPAVRHPALEGPVAFLGGHELAPLLAGFPGGFTPVEIARAWSDRLPFQTGLAMLAWLANNGLLAHEPPGESPDAPPAATD